MPSRISSVDENWWTDHLQSCPDTGIGYAGNTMYRHNGQLSQVHDIEDTSFNCKYEADIALYGVFDGFEGKSVAEFAAQKFPAEILLDNQLTKSNADDAKVRSVLEQAFYSVENGYLHNVIGEDIANREQLQEQIQGMTAYEAEQKRPDTLAKIEELNKQIFGGATAVIALILRNRLYVANVGDSRVLLMQEYPGDCRVYQLSKTHDTRDEDEKQRLKAIGISEGEFGYPYCTRCLGDFRRKGGYKEMNCMSHASAEPVITTPYVTSYPIAPWFRYLVAMSGGVISALEDAGKTDVNTEVARLILEEAQNNTVVREVAQAVVDRICRTHKDAFLSCDDRSLLCQQREDMTLLIRRFGSPEGLEAVDPTKTFTLPVTTSGDVFGSVRSTTVTQNSDEGEQEATKLELDENGRVKAYVDFSEFYQKADWFYSQMPDYAPTTSETEVVFDC